MLMIPMAGLSYFFTCLGKNPGFKPETDKYLDAINMPRLGADWHFGHKFGYFMPTIFDLQLYNFD